MQDFSFKGHEDWTNNVFNNKEIIVDSGTSMILMPKNDMKTWFNIMRKEIGIDCGVAKNLPKCDCT